MVGLLSWICIWSSLWLTTVSSTQAFLGFSVCSPIFFALSRFLILKCRLFVEFRFLTDSLFYSRKPCVENAYVYPSDSVGYKASYQHRLICRTRGWCSQKWNFVNETTPETMKTEVKMLIYYGDFTVENPCVMLKCLRVP